MGYWVVRNGIKVVIKRMKVKRFGMIGGIFWDIFYFWR